MIIGQSRVSKYIGLGPDSNHKGLGPVPDQGFIPVASGNEFGPDPAAAQFGLDITPPAIPAFMQNPYSRPQIKGTVLKFIKIRIPGPAIYRIIRGEGPLISKTDDHAIPDRNLFPDHGDIHQGLDRVEKFQIYRLPGSSEKRLAPKF